MPLSFVFVEPPFEGQECAPAQPGAPRPQPTAPNSAWLEAALLGGLRGLARLPLEHPFERVKTAWQADPSLRNWRDVWGSVLRQGGPRALFDGTLPNGVRMTVKEAYRWPLMVALPPLFAHGLPALLAKTPRLALPPAARTDEARGDRSPERALSGGPGRSATANGAQLNGACQTNVGLQTNGACQTNEALAKALAGFAIANLEALIICPLERLKVALMTAGTGAPSSALPGSRSRAGRRLGPPAALLAPRELFRGLSAVYVRQVVSWVSFLWADAVGKRAARRLGGCDDLSTAQLLAVALGVGMFNTALVMPADCVKTQMQMVKTPAFTSIPGQCPRSMRAVTADIWRQHGPRGFYVGWRVRLLQYLLNAALSVALLDHLERRWAAFWPDQTE